METSVNLDNIKAAQARISPWVPSTPVLPSLFLKQSCGIDTFLKLENLNISGSFKIRGATNALLQAPSEVLQNGVVAASAGNHAQGVALVCNRLGRRATIFMPEATPLIKVESTRMMGAEVVCTGNIVDDSFVAAKKFCEETSGFFIHPFAHPEVISGQGTVGVELHYQIPDLDAVIVPIGGGGLIGGISCALKSLRPGIKIFGVQSEAFCPVRDSFRAGHIIHSKPGVTIADGIAVKSVAELNFSLIKKYVDDIFVVGEEEIAAAIMLLAERNHLLAEGAGAVPVAALMKHKDELAKMGLKNIALVISGGNIDFNLLNRISSRGLIQSGRLSRLRFNLRDRPGALAALLNVISAAGANLNEVHHQRTFSTSHYSDVEVEAIVETSNHMHRSSLLDALKKNHFEFKIIE